MKKWNRQSGSRGRQQGALMLVTMLFLLMISMLGMATMDTGGLEMQMSSNSRAQQQAFEAAEYTLSQVESDIAVATYFSDSSLSGANCGSTCFSTACGNGYCFNGSDAADWKLCRLGTPELEPYAMASLWEDGSGQYRTLEIPGTGITTRYIIEFWCYTAKDSAHPIAEDNHARMFRITAYALSEDGRARTMLRSKIKES